MDRGVHSSSEDSRQYSAQQTVSLSGVASYLKALDVERLLLCLLSAVAIYAAGYIVAWLFFSGVMFFLLLGLVVFLAMEIADSVDHSVGDARYHRDF